MPASRRADVSPQRSIDHVVLERGEVANSWRRERWDSLRLLTPNWQSRLPGFGYDGADPDGYMTMREVIDFHLALRRRVERARAHAHHGDVGQTDRCRIRRRDEQRRLPLPHADASPAAHAMCPASRRSARPCRPRFESRHAVRLPQSRRAARGGVLVVGASATGVQLADEIQRSGRPVTLSVGEHVRLPRTYRGRDVLWWMDASGVWNQRYDEVDDLTRARRLPSPQLVGTPERRRWISTRSARSGVELVGRLSAVRDGRALFSGGLRNQFRARRSEDGSSARHVRRVGRRAGHDGRRRSAGAVRADARARLVAAQLDLRERRDPNRSSGQRGSVRITAGCDVPVIDDKGHLRHDGGVVDAPGLYALGLPVLRRRKSTFIHGIEDDAREIVDRLVGHLG